MRVGPGTWPSNEGGPVYSRIRVDGLVETQSPIFIKDDCVKIARPKASEWWEIPLHFDPGYLLPLSSDGERLPPGN